VSKHTRHSKRGRDERTIADVLAQAISAIQSQKIPADEAMRAAMETIGASQKAALDLLLYAARAQAEVVHELLADGAAQTHSFASGVGNLLLEAVERSPEVIGSFTAGLAGFVDALTSPVKPLPESQPAAAPDSVLAHPAPEPQPLGESESLDAIVRAIADGYSVGRPGGTVAHSIRERYPTAIPVIQRYLAMDDFLVLMWLRQQAALAELAADREFPRFYAELKAEIQQPSG
jgi:hypothetical protein